MAEKIPLDELIGLVKKEIDEKTLSDGIKRQAAVWEGKEPDYLPLVFGGAIPEKDRYPKYDFKEQFYDPEKMFYAQLWDVLGIVRGKSDAVFSLRVNFGTGFLASAFGLNQEIFPDKMPWLKEHLSKDEILKLKPETLAPLAKRGLLPEFKRYVQFYKSKLKNLPVHIYLPDTQGTFDIAHLIFGDDIFTELYDDPPFVSHLFSLAEYVYRNASLLMKEWLNEPLTNAYHSGVFYMSGCGVRSCEDTTTLLSPGLIKELIIPYIRKSVAPFGGWVHFCGNGQSLLEPLLAAQEIKGINFGNPEKFNWNITMAKITDAKKVYAGSIPRNKNEQLKDYFIRILSLLKKKNTLILMPELSESDNEKALALWHHLQDKMFV